MSWDGIRGDCKRGKFPFFFFFLLLRTKSEEHFATIPGASIVSETRVSDKVPGRAAMPSVHQLWRPKERKVIFMSTQQRFDGKNLVHKCNYVLL